MAGEVGIPFQQKAIGRQETNQLSVLYFFLNYENIYKSVQLRRATVQAIENPMKVPDYILEATTVGDSFVGLQDTDLRHTDTRPAVNLESK